MLQTGTVSLSAHVEIAAIVRAVRSVASDVIVLELCHADGDPLPAWEPGAHIDVLLPSGLVRQYSLCGRPEVRETYQIAVLRVPDGRGGSAQMHELLTTGTQVRIRGPRNNFPLVDAPEYLFLAGGIGITPILPMIDEVEARGRPWRLYYGGRNRASMAFADGLTADYPDRVSVVPQETEGLLDVATLISDARAGTSVYACGPAPLLAAVEGHWAPRRAEIDLHIERFATGGSSVGPDTPFEVELRRSGVTIEVPAGRTILQAVLDTIGEVPYSCEEGICGTCETALLAGVPDHRDELLSDEERASNATMMICVSRARSKRLVLDL